MHDVERPPPVDDQTSSTAAAAGEGAWDGDGNSSKPAPIDVDVGRERPIAVGPRAPEIEVDPRCSTHTVIHPSVGAREFFNGSSWDLPILVPQEEKLRLSQATQDQKHSVCGYSKLSHASQSLMHA